VGEVFKRHLETGGTVLDFDASRLKRLYDELFEKGKELANDLREEGRSTEVKVSGEASVVIDSVDQESKETGASKVNQIKELAKLKSEGFISEDEFELLKKELLS